MKNGENKAKIFILKKTKKLFKTPVLLGRKWHKIKNCGNWNGTLKKTKDETIH